MRQLKIFIDLTRLNKPIGFMLLFWPCSWGLAYAFSYHKDLNIFLYFLTLFFFGSILMRSAGCIINDIVDKNFDKKVKRTKNRPIASGKISVTRSFIYSMVLCFFSFLILIQFNLFTIILGMSSMILAFSYPYMKRITYWPQLFLGLTFNWGIIMAWVASNNTISPEIILLYTSAIFWTLAYDSINGLQDIADDEIIGLKSTAIKFKKNIKLFVSMNYFLTFTILLYLFKDEISLNLFSIIFILFCLSLVYQVKIFDSRKPITCLKAFKLNNLSGFILFIGILSIQN